MRKTLLFLLLLPSLAMAQASRFDSSVVQQGTIDTTTNALIIPANPQINVCNFPANGSPCTNLATTYSSITLGTPCPTSTQLTIGTSNSCVSSPDSQGNWGVWVVPGIYTFTVTVNGANYGPYIMQPGGGGGGSGGSNLRLQLLGGTPLTPANFALSGWGTGAAVTQVTGTDSSFNVTIQAGTSPTLGATATLNFANGPWALITSVNTNWNGGAPAGDITWATNGSFSNLTLTYNNLPIPGNSYSLDVTVVGQSNAFVPSSPINPVVTNPAANQIIIGAGFSLTLQGALIAQNGITSLSNTNLLGPTICKTFETVKCVDAANTAGWAGSDWGAWVNSADLALGGTPGEIWLAAAGLTATSAITLNAGHVLRIIQPGTYTTSAMMTLAGTGSEIVGGSQYGSGGGATVNSPYYILEAPASNLPAVIKMTGSLNQVSGVTVDGNQNPVLFNTNNPCPSPPCYGIWIFKALRAVVNNTTVQQVATNGIRIESSHPFSGGGNESAAAKVVNSQVVFTTGSAIKTTDTADTEYINTEGGEANIGLDLIDAGTARVVNGDYGGNTLYGISVTCTGLDAGTGGPLIAPKQLGTNKQHQLYVNGWTGTGSQQGAACLDGSVIGAELITGSGAGYSSGTYDGIFVQDTGGWTFTGNTSSNANGGVALKNGIEITQVNTTEGIDVLSGNNLQGVTNHGCVLLPITLATGNASNQDCPIQALYKTVDLAAQTANVAATPFFTVPTPATPYRVSISAVATTTGTTWTLPTACILWTDTDSNAAQQQIFNVTQSGATNSNPSTAAEYGTVPIVNAKAGTSISYSFGSACTGGSAYASTGTALQYAAHVKVGAP